MSGQSRVISELIRTEVTGKGEPAASAVEAGSLDGGRGVRIRSTGDTMNETKLAGPSGSVDRNRWMRNRTSGGVGGRRA